MPIVITPTCKRCGTAIEQLEAVAGTWIHTGLSIWCPGSGDRYTAAPIVTHVPLGP